MRVTFRLGVAFPPSSPVSRFLVRLALVRNDLVLVSRSLDQALQEPDIAVPPAYHIPVCASHYREASKMLQDELADPAVRRFVDSLPASTRNRLRKVEASFSPWKGSFVERALKPVRDSTFHYPDAGGIVDAMKRVASQTTSVDYGTGKVIDTRYRFADEVLVSFLSPRFGGSPKDVESTSWELARLMVELVFFADEAITVYLDRLNVGILRPEE